MTRKVTNRRVGPKNKDNPTGKHASLLQNVTYFESIDHPMKEDERVRMQKEFASNGSVTKPFDLPTLLEKYRFFAIQYLENSPHDHTKCENWEWGFTLTNEYKAAAHLDGGFAAAFRILNTIKQIENKVKKGEFKKAIALSLHLGFYGRNLVRAEMEALYHAGKTKTEAANASKSEAKYEAMLVARPIYEEYLAISQKKNGWPNATWAATHTSKKLLVEHNIKRASSTIRDWFSN